jgi:hypothetical protein
MSSDLSNSKPSMPDCWDIGPELSLVKEELEHIGAQENLGLFLTIIQNHADQMGQSILAVEKQDYSAILKELNGLYRKFKRSMVSEQMIHRELNNLSSPAQTFVNLELAYHLKRTVNLKAENWSNTELQKTLEQSVGKARGWARQSPGPQISIEVHIFCREVMRVYMQIAEENPGVGNSNYDPGYMTSFEKLWHASLRLIRQDATVLEAREIFRKASGRR